MKRDCVMRDILKNQQQAFIREGAVTADTIKGVRKWMTPQRRKPTFPMGLFGASARVEYVPKGVVGNLATWNFPIYTSFLPVAGIFGATAPW
jgi:acyl-CoA reductase-like NAD-dependent aldehyde dehydrogenase